MPLKLRGSRENWTPFALLTSVALCPSAHNQSQIPEIPLPFLQSLTGDLPRKVSGNSGGHFVYFGREVRSCRYSREVRRSMVAVARLHY
jgi:hypothetical protein